MDSFFLGWRWYLGCTDLSWAMQVDWILEGVAGSEVGDGDVSISRDQKTFLIILVF